MLDYKKTIVYFRDQWMPFNEANLSIASSPVLYGLSVYTVFNAIWNEDKKELNVFRLKDHYNRLCNSASIMDFENFENKYSYEEFEKMMKELLYKNKVQENALVRVTLFIDELIAGTKINGLKNSMSAYVYPMGEILPKSGVNVCVSSWTRASDNMIPARAKVNGQYVNASLMKNEALQNGYDEAIALDSSGHVSEGTVANLFIIRDGKLITPDMATDILEGITRNSIIEIANELGIEHEQRTIDRTELYIADEAFMCGSSANVTPILSVDKRKVANGKIGKITKMISDEYSKIQKSENPRFAKWITKV
ncbi:branched chain amino acid aminotransferase [Candidatus Saccharibacteria bacterium]|nr:branched chain amino acid aminotransferase [Candidatus Saccharibacteria bacterium]